MRAAVTIGNFDGVHRGHQALIHEVVAWRRQHPHRQEIKTIALTFDPHPREVLNPEVNVMRLCSLNDRIRLLEEMGIDEVRVIKFNKDYAQISAKEFFNDVLLQNLKAEFIAVGHNFYFGKNREGSPGKIIDWCEERGIDSKLVNPIEVDGAPVSSTRIRELIKKGEIISASRLLGRQFFISGRVSQGNQKGATIGFHTANVYPSYQGPGALCLPPKGVYLTSTTIENGKTYASISNLGVRPTVQEKSPLVLETHLLDYEGDLYGKLISVEFRDSIRAEMKFPSIEALRQQIQVDIELARLKLKAK